MYSYKNNKQYLENFAFLLRILKLFACEFVNVLESRPIFILMYCFCMFVNKHFLNCKRCFNVKSKTKILTNLQICISVPLKDCTYILNDLELSVICTPADYNTNHHISHLVQVNKYMSKVNNWNTKKVWNLFEINNKVTRTTRRSGVCIVHSKHIAQFFSIFLFVIGFEKVNIWWVMLN